MTAPSLQSVLVLLLSPGELFPHNVEAGAEAVVLAEQCLLQCWLAREPPPSSGAPPPAWASRDVLPFVLGRLTGRAILVQAEPLDLPNLKEGAYARSAIQAR